jgi:hypothetical protein
VNDQDAILFVAIELDIELSGVVVSVVVLVAAGLEQAAMLRAARAAPARANRRSTLEVMSWFP